MRFARITQLALVTVFALVTAACGGPSPDSGSSGRDDTLTVYAAASLREAFGDLERRFEQDNPTVDVVLNFAGSSDLAQQISEGAPADVFASADEGTMGAAVHARGSRPEYPVEVFATNSLTIAVPKGNPKGISGPADLADPGTTVVVCAPQVPCGKLSQRLLGIAGVTVNPASEENDVTSVRNKVALGEADAGLVYKTDVQAERDRLDAVDFPEAATLANRYPIVVLRDAGSASAGAFVTMVRGDIGQRILRDRGFAAP